MNMKKIYVILSRTGTFPSNLIKLATKAEFTHSSIAITPNRHQLYSFARRRLHNIFIAGFLHEDVDKFVFAKYPNAPCAVYEIKVSDEGYNKITNKLIAFDKKYKKHKYSFVGTLTTQFGIKRNLKYRYTCAQFVASMLCASEEVTLPKHPSLMKPMDFADIPEAKIIYYGQLKNIDFKGKN
jgi:hypothetical protein